MNGALIAAYVLLYLLVGFGGVYFYTYYTYTKNRVFNKFKYLSFTLLFLCITLVFTLVMGILFATLIKNKGTIPDIPTHLALCFSLVGINCLYIGLYFLIVAINNKNKIAYGEINGLDFNAKLAAAKADLGDIEIAKANLLKKHKRYYLAMIEQYKICLERAKDPTLTRTAKLADIVQFNDIFTHKWSSKINKYQLVLTYEYLTII